MSRRAAVASLFGEDAMSTRKEEIERLEERIKTYRRWINKKRDSIENGSKKTGKPLAEITVKDYWASINDFLGTIKKEEKEIERLKNLPPSYDEFSKMDRIELICEAVRLQRENQQYELELRKWTDWHKGHRHKAPGKRREVPGGWRVVVTDRRAQA
jgi:hypothetical protein